MREWVVGSAKVGSMTVGLQVSNKNKKSLFWNFEPLEAMTVGDRGLHNPRNLILRILKRPEAREVGGRPTTIQCLPCSGF